jgi:hypothetical protein
MYATQAYTARPLYATLNWKLQVGPTVWWTHAGLFTLDYDWGVGRDWWAIRKQMPDWYCGIAFYTIFPGGKYGMETEIITHGRRFLHQRLNIPTIQEKMIDTGYLHDSYVASTDPNDPTKNFYEKATIRIVG